METQSRPALSDQERWESRRFAAFLVRFAIFVVPLVAGFFAGAAVSHRLPDPETVAQLIQWWVLTIMVASIAATIVDRIARRYLPLVDAAEDDDVVPERGTVAAQGGPSLRLDRRAEEADRFRVRRGRPLSRRSRRVDSLAVRGTRQTRPSHQRTLRAGTCLRRPDRRRARVEPRRSRPAPVGSPPPRHREARSLR